MRKLFGKMTDGSGEKANQLCLEGNTLASQGQHSEALVCLEKALQIDSKHALTWFNMGLTLMNMGRNDEAIKAFTNFIQYAPQEAKQLHVPMAKGYMELLSKGTNAHQINLH
jgi:tetratricopeptide (TPR) repeat protein